MEKLKFEMNFIDIFDRFKRLFKALIVVKFCFQLFSNYIFMFFIEGFWGLSLCQFVSLESLPQAVEPEYV